jgi:hypothetical protein
VHMSFSSIQSNIQRHTFMYIGVLGACISSLVLILLAMGRTPFGPNGFGIWTSDAWSNNNSQLIADPYTLSHILHGCIFYLVLTYFWRGSNFRVVSIVSVIIEALWEILENTPFIINRYRETAALGYTGDSILNSVGDTLFCLLGVYIASLLPLRFTVLLFVAIEVAMLILFRDNLSLNVIMLLYPFETIKNWQTQF